MYQPWRELRQNCASVATMGAGSTLTLELNFDVYVLLPSSSRFRALQETALAVWIPCSWGYACAE